MENNRTWAVVNLSNVLVDTQDMRNKEESVFPLDTDFSRLAAKKYYETCIVCGEHGTSTKCLRMLAADVFAFAETLTGHTLSWDATERAIQAGICAEHVCRAHDPASDLVRGRFPSTQDWRDLPFKGSAWAVAMQDLGYDPHTSIEDVVSGTAVVCSRPESKAAMPGNGNGPSA